VLILQKQRLLFWGLLTFFETLKRIEVKDPFAVSSLDADNTSISKNKLSEDSEDAA
jgi:hypothetical protein